MGEIRTAYIVLVGKPLRVGVKLRVREINYGGMD
jgi:hypothetical protein